MRVIAGTAKGHKLQSPEGIEIRPTIDRIKETLFNIIAPDLDECKFLDLFSGTGAIGIEALSRGAKQAVFVDNSSKKIIEYNLNHTKLNDKAQIYADDVFDIINKLGKQQEKFDIIFLDPPYKKNYADECLLSIKNKNILNDDGYIIVEHETKCKLNLPEEFQIFREKIYTKTTMTFIKKERDAI